MQVIATRTFTRVMPNGHYVRAVAKLDQIDSNARPHFSLTGEEWETFKHYERRTNRETGLLGMGAMHETILEAFPELAAFAALHLADDDGTPMHAVANGWYAYSREAHAYEQASPYYGEPSDTPHARAAHTLRVTPEELPEGLDKEAFTAFADSLRPRWKQEADDALAFLKQ